MKKTTTAAGAASPTIGSATAWINFITWSALEILKQIVAESARTGKSIAELIEEAQAQTKLNAAQIDELKARLTNPQA
jgi:urease gamma subunit